MRANKTSTNGYTAALSGAPAESPSVSPSSVDVRLTEFRESTDRLWQLTQQTERIADYVSGIEPECPQEQGPSAAPEANGLGEKLGVLVQHINELASRMEYQLGRTEKALMG